MTFVYLKAMGHLDAKCLFYEGFNADGNWLLGSALGHNFRFRVLTPHAAFTAYGKLQWQSRYQ